MKKILASILAFFSLGSAAETTEPTAAATAAAVSEYTVISGEVLEINDSSLTLLLDMGEAPNGEAPDGQMPEKPDGDAPNGQAPEKPDGDAPNGHPPEMPNGQAPNGQMPGGRISIAANLTGSAAVENNAVITIGEGCTWKLTGDCTVTSLTNNGTIDFNGYTITLADGSVLK